MKRVAHRFVRSSFFASVIDSMSGFGARPVLHTSNPKFTTHTRGRSAELIQDVMKGQEDTRRTLSLFGHEHTALAGVGS